MKKTTSPSKPVIITESLLELLYRTKDLACTLPESDTRLLLIAMLKDAIHIEIMTRETL